MFTVYLLMVDVVNHVVEQNRVRQTSRACIFCLSQNTASEFLSW